MNIDRSTVFLLANLGSEISRLYAFKNKGQKAMMMASAVRANSIVETLINHPDIGNGKAEVEALQKIINAIVADDGYIQEEKIVQSYFTPFAHRALAGN